MDKVHLTEAQWKEKLTDEQYRVCRLKGTERPFSGKYNDFKEKGIYTCIACKAPLFHSKSKYDSRSGWPSFFEPINDKCLSYHEDLSLTPRRIEVTCNRCGSHLGHVFGDGPPPTGKRYCINSTALNFINE